MYTETKIPVKDIAFEIGCAESAVYDALRRNGVPLVNRRSEHKYDELDVESIIADYKEAGGVDKEWKYSLAEILAKYGIGMNRFYALLRFVGVEPRKIAAQVARSIRMDYAVEMYQRGDLMGQINADTGITPGSLHMELAKRGIKPNRRDPGFDYDKACKLYVDGVSLVDIYIQTGVANTPKLYKEFRKRGIALRKPRQQNDSDLAQFFRGLPPDQQDILRTAVEAVRADDAHDRASSQPGSSQTDSS